MAAWVIKNMGGLIPRMESRALPDNMAEEAVNCDLSSGALNGLPQPELVHDFSANPATIKRAYRFPNPTGDGTEVWLPLPSPYSSVVKSPLANDPNERVYWTNPGDNSPHFNTYSSLNIGAAPIDVGIPQPSTTLSVAAVGGAQIPQVSRSYCYTYVNSFGEESAPSPLSSVVTGAPDADWQITGIPQPGAITNPVGYLYPVCNQVNLYRTITGTETGASFFLVQSFVGGVNDPPFTYPDTSSDLTVVNNQQLISTGWANPPVGLDGLTALPGGMLAGFTGNTIHFCEPDRPHAWPPAYDQSLQYPIVALGVWQQSLVVLTSGFPSTGSGNSPSNYVFTQIRVPEPCISRGSVITDLMGVYYASQNGLVMLNYFGMQNQTLSLVTKNIWLNDFKAASIIACRHRAQYLAVNGSGTGFLIDYSEARLGMMDLSSINGATCIWNDEFTGDAYIMGGDKKVYRWDSQNTGSLIFRWRSKQFYLPAPVSLGACQISLDPSVETVLPTYAPPATLQNNDPTLVLPAGVNAVFNLYYGSTTSSPTLLISKNLTKSRMIFRLPGGFKAFDWQAEIVSRVPVHSIELASTMAELKGV